MDIHDKTRTLIVWHLIYALNVICIYAVAPTNLILTNNQINENLVAGTLIDTLSTIDPDSDNVFTYQLVSGSGSADNTYFTITGNQLLSRIIFDYNTKTSCSVRIRTTDSETLFFEKVFTINIIDINEPPINITLSPASINEGQDAETPVGTFSTNDPDQNDNFTYTFLTGSGGEDNSSFAIDGSLLKTATVLDFNAKPTCSVLVRTTDTEGLTFDKAFAITVNNINLQPVNITLTPSSINEDQPIGTTVGALTSADPDPADTFTYTFVTGGTDNISFTLARNILKTAEVFDYNIKPTCSVRLRTTDAGGLTFDKTIPITIVNINQKPTNITLTPASINEGLSIGTTVGVLTSADPDTNDTFTYTFATGGADNNSFTLDGNILKAAVVFDYDTKPTCSVRIRTTDAGGLTLNKTITISIVNINQKPTNITLSPTSINEGQVIGSTVGILASSDPDKSDSFTYSLVSGAGDTDNTSFTITGNTLKSAAVFDFNLKNTYSVRINSTDNGGLTFEKIFTITITNINQPPTNITLAPASITENQPSGTTVGSLTATDPDIGDKFTYALVSGTGSNDNSNFSIAGNELRTKVSFNYELKQSYSIRVRATDNGTATFEKAIIITIININELPTNIVLLPNSITENKPVNTLVGMLSTTDPDSAVDFLYSFTPGSGSADNHKFIISGKELRSNEVFNYENQPACSIRIKTTNGMIESFEKALLVKIRDTSDAPVITDIETSPLIYNEDDPSRIISSTLKLYDEDSSIPQSASIQISENFLSTEDSLYYTSVVGIKTSYVNNGYLKATGKATFAVYQNFLRSIKYKNFNLANPSEDQRSVKFLVSDGTNTSLPVYRYIQVKRVNDPPKVSNLSIKANKFIVDELLNAQYTFIDPDGDPQGMSTFQWYTATSSTGLKKTIINGATAITFTVSLFEGGKYIGYTVTPVDSKGLAGKSVSSVWYYINAAPEFSDSTIFNMAHPDIIADGETVEANFPYYDKESNEAGTHAYQWYYSSTGNWNSTSPISGQKELTYIISSTYINKYIAVKGIPKAISGSLAGKEYRTGWYLVAALPTATISGIKTICKDVTSTTLNVALTGTAPWTLTYKINNKKPIKIEGIYSESGNFLLPARDTGTYTLVAVSDKKHTFGRVSGIGKIKYFQNPSAQLTLPSLSICANDTSTYSIPIVLTGTAPWSVTYTVNGLNPKEISFNSSKNTSIPVNYASKGNYAITKVADINCYGTVTGKTNVIEKSSPKAIMSGDTSICPPANAMLHVSLTGNGPWTFYYTKNNGPVDSLYVNFNTNKFNYSIPISSVGNYKLTGVKDEDQTGCVFGDATVRHYEIPISNISGDLLVCEGSIGTINVNLTGFPPWNIKYSLNGTYEASVTGIIQSPYLLPATKAGEYRIDSLNDLHCKGSGTGIVNVKKSTVPKVSITGLDTIYTRETVSVPVYFYPPGGTHDESDKPNAFLLISGKLAFSPLLADTAGSPHWIRYKYKDPATSCYGKDSLRVFVIAKDAVIQIHNETLDKQEKLCFNYGPLLIEGIKSGSDTGHFSINETPEALVEVSPNTAYLLPDKIQTGKRTVTFSYKVGGITQIVKRDFNFEKIDADFEWDNDCFSGTTRVNLYDQSKEESGSTLEHHYWSIRFPTTTKKFDAPEIGVDFHSLSTYPIKYIVVSNFGCTDTVKKDLTFKPTINPKESNYQEDFTEGSGYWSSSPMIADSLNTWTLDRPQGKFFKDSPGASAWYTNVVNVSKTEHSYVISPCFNFENTSRPMIKMNIWRGFTNAASVDGASLQYSSDNEQTWNLIGDIKDDINWYNSEEIEGAPGYNGTGWASAGDYKQDTSWVECRHILDNLIGKPNVKFRIAYSSSNRSLVRDGFAFDNVWIGERSKKALIEHFTNSGSEACKNANIKLNTVVNKNAIDVIDLQYHMYGPGIDTFYTLNPYPAYSRNIYYNLPEVPYAIMDGGYQNDLFNFDTRYLKKEDIIPIILQDNIFYLKANAEYAGDVLDITVDFKALSYVSKRPVTVHVVIIENEIKTIRGENGETVFESVVRDMIPSVTGTSYNQVWEIGATEHFNLDWDIANIFDREQLRVVAYIQDETTREIYQASIDNPNVETGIKETILKKDNTFLIYPNPTFGRTSIYWKNQLHQSSLLEITDNLGRKVWEGMMLAGVQEMIISLKGLKAGTYIFRATSDSKNYESQKIILLSNQ